MSNTTPCAAFLGIFGNVPTPNPLCPVGSSPLVSSALASAYSGLFARLTLIGEVNAGRRLEHLSERVPKHSMQDVVTIYDRYDYLKEKRERLEAPAGLVVQSIVGHSAKVAPITGKATSK